MMRRILTRLSLLVAITLMALAACTPRPADDIRLMTTPAAVYPDYVDVTIPVNIAPLNFMLRDSATAVECRAAAGGKEVVARAKGGKVIFDEDSWHDLLHAAAGGDIAVTLSALYSTEQGREEWRQWQWQWHVAKTVSTHISPTD